MKKPDRLKECYRILGVSPGATLRQVKKVFHEKALLYHPDANPSQAAAAEFKNISCAYGMIRDHLRKHEAEAKKQAAGGAGQAGEGAVAGARAHGAASTCKLCERDARVGDVAARLSCDELAFRLEHSQNPYVRLHAVRALAVQGGKPAAWHIIRALTDQDPAVARTAAQALGALNARAATMPLIRLHQKSSPETQQAIESALARIDSPLARRFTASANAGKNGNRQQQQSPDIA